MPHVRCRGIVTPAVMALCEDRHGIDMAFFQGADELVFVKFPTDIRAVFRGVEIEVYLSVAEFGVFHCFSFAVLVSIICNNALICLRV